MLRKRSALFRVATAIVAFAIALEFGLQVLAMVMHLIHAPAEGSAEISPAAPDRRVLCIGDSFTYGMGASEGSGAYPAQLARELGAGWSVSNVGRPGLDSRGVVEELAANLRRYRPRYACVLIGVNDAWRRRGRASTARDDVSGFEWRWRTADLVRLLIHGIGLFRDRAIPADDAPRGVPPDHPLIGAWVDASTGIHVTFWASGIADIGTTHLPWSVVDGDGARVRLGEETGGRTLTIAFRDGAALLESPGAPPMLLIHDAAAATGVSATREGVARVVAAYGAGRHDEVVHAGREIVDSGSLDPDQMLEVLGMLAHSQSLLGAQQDVEHTLDVLRAEHARRGYPKSRSALGHALTQTFRYREALAVFDAAEGDLASLSTSDLVDVAESGSRGLERDPALRIVDRVLTAASGRSEVPGALWLSRYHALPLDDIEESMRCLLRAWRASGPTPEMLLTLRQERALRLDAAKWPAIARGLGVPDEELAVFVARWREGTGIGLDQTWVEDLRANLLALERMCDAAGTTVVYATYPFEGPTANRVLRDMTPKDPGRLADVQARFRALSSPRGALFVADGHCSDAGYAEIAASFAERLRAIAR